MCLYSIAQIDYYIVLGRIAFTWTHRTDYVKYTHRARLTLFDSKIHATPPVFYQEFLVLYDIIIVLGCLAYSPWKFPLLMNVLAFFVKLYR